VEVLKSEFLSNKHSKYNLFEECNLYLCKLQNKKLKRFSPIYQKTARWRIFSIIYMFYKKSNAVWMMPEMVEFIHRKKLKHVCQNGSENSLVL